MERQIKFRAWLQDESQMVFSNDQASTDGCEVWIFYDGGLNVQVQETVWREGGGETFERIEYVDCTHTIMQFTGLTDKNGKEIYEGDIAVIKNGDPFAPVTKVIVQYQTGCFGIMPTSGEVDVFANNYSGNMLPFFPEYNPVVFEVIGNIYETPELLK